MTSYLALYRGNAFSRATLLAVSSDPDLVRQFANEMLDGQDQGQLTFCGDPAEDAIAEGKQKALKIVRNETHRRTGGGENG